MSAVSGKTILDLLWEKLDEIVTALAVQWPDMRDDETFLMGTDTDPVEIFEWAELRGQAQGLALAIATIQNPYAPDVDDVRAEAGSRLAERQQQWMTFDDEALVHQGNGQPVPRPRDQEK